MIAAGSGWTGIVLADGVPLLRSGRQFAAFWRSLEFKPLLQHDPPLERRLCIPRAELHQVYEKRVGTRIAG